LITLALCTFRQALAIRFPNNLSHITGIISKFWKGKLPLRLWAKWTFAVKGVMFGGFAVAAAAVQYRVTGVQAFIVGPSGVVYQKGLAADTLKAFQSMDRYNPDIT
jgi:hypothetical protein